VTAGPADQEDFLLANTVPMAAALVPEITLHLATEITPIWRATEAWLATEGIEPPFWAFAWPGSQVLARMVLDDPSLVRGRRVLDFAAGCGLAAIACAIAGADAVEAAEIDAMAITATRLNAAANGVMVRAECGDIVGAACRWDVILCGDVCYERPMTAHVLPWLRLMAAAGAEVLVADPGRAYVPREGITKLYEMAVATTLELEDRTERIVTVYRLESA
jgi:predicted nicotinamide N-methyase